MSDMGYISVFKIVHFSALILWLGPGIGAWWMLRHALFRFDDPSLVSHFFYRAFLRLMWLEHMALAVVLASGTVLAVLTHAHESDWFRYKLLLVVLVVVPLEVVDIWYSHVRLPAILCGRHPSRTYTPAEGHTLHVYHNRFPTAHPGSPCTSSRKGTAALWRRVSLAARTLPATAPSAWP